MLPVVGAHRNGVQLEALIRQHLGVILIIALDIRLAKLLEKRLGTAGDQIAASHNLDIRLVEVAVHMRMRNAAAADDADTQLAAGIDGGLFLVFLKGVQAILVRHKTHSFFFSLYIT